MLQSITEHKPVVRGTVLALLVLLAGCSHTATNDNEEIGHYVFDVYEENHSWGHTLRGFVIQRDGRVLTYDRGNQRWAPTHNRSGRLAEADLANKFHGSKIRLTLPADAVRAKAQLLPAAVRGSITRVGQSNDRGRFAYVGYIYDPDRINYRAVVIGADGDWLETNTAPAAQELLKWLVEVKEKMSDAQR